MRAASKQFPKQARGLVDPGRPSVPDRRDASVCRQRRTGRRAAGCAGGGNSRGRQSGAGSKTSTGGSDFVFLVNGNVAASTLDPSPQREIEAGRLAARGSSKCRSPDRITISSPSALERCARQSSGRAAHPALFRCRARPHRADAASPGDSMDRGGACRHPAHLPSRAPTAPPGGSTGPRGCRNRQRATTMCACRCRAATKSAAWPAPSTACARPSARAARI